MNLVELSQDLEYIPTDELVQMINNPNARYPSFLVLSEVQRRNQNKMSYDAQVNSQRPDTTVAEEAVANLTGGLAGISSNQPLSSPMGESPVGGDVPASGLRMMAEGGITGYNEGGMSYFDRALGAIKGRYMDEDGFDKSQIASDLTLGALTFTPFGLGARGIFTGVTKGLPALFKRGLSAYNRRVASPIGTAAFKAMTPKMRDNYLRRMGIGPSKAQRLAGKSSIDASALGNIITRRAALAGGLGSLAFGGEDDDIKPMEEIDDIGDVGEQPSGLSGNDVSGTNETSIDPFDMARMGFALMGARDTSELAKGLGSIAEDIQTRRREAPLVKAQLAEIQAKVNYYNSQGQYGLADQLYKLASSLSAQISALLETGNAEEAGKVARRLAEVNRAYGGELGIQSPSEEDIVEKNRVK
tara:strand:- start:4731 stop:5975 length:1245 start_codon:yes stop_codon:yes gene_type:complete